MDASIPASAARILDFIGQTEAPRGYDTVFGNNKMPKRLTAMTLDEVIADGPRRTRQYRSSACGRYQFMTATLKGLKKELGLSGSERFDADFQDRLAFHLLKRRKWEQFEAGKIGLSVFAKNLAMEWASFPVLKPCQGAHRRIARGESYYAGDKLNKALVKPEQIEALLAVPQATTKEPTTMPETLTPIQIPGTKKEVLPVPQVTQNPLTSKTTIGILVSVISFLASAFPNWIPAAIVPIVETGAPIVVGIIGAGIALWGRFTAEGPLKFVFGGGMSEVAQLRNQMAELQALAAQLQAELAKKKRAKV